MPIRKHPRLKTYDYSSYGAYFVTICTFQKKKILSEIVGRGLAPAKVSLTNYGSIVQEELLDLEKRYPSLEIEYYVIMPNHIHIIFLLKNDVAGASPRPTLMDIVCTLKSLAARKCKQAGYVQKVFQDSFYEHIIRNRHDYDEIANYICSNPERWNSDRFYTE